jgi:histone-lysine N-methyltransferase SETD2
MRYETDAGGHITHFFIAPRASICLFKAHPDVMLMDCTYKTNRFNMPMFNICGVTNIRKTFQVATVFLDSKKEEKFA